MRLKMPYRSSNLQHFCAFLERYSLRSQPSDCVKLLKALGVNSITGACQVMRFGLKWPKRLRDRTIILRAHNPHFEWDAYSSTFLSQTISRKALYVAIFLGSFSTRHIPGRAP